MSDDGVEQEGFLIQVNGPKPYRDAIFAYLTGQSLDHNLFMELLKEATVQRLDSEILQSIQNENVEGGSVGSTDTAVCSEHFEEETVEQPSMNLQSILSRIAMATARPPIPINENVLNELAEYELNPSTIQPATSSETPDTFMGLIAALENVPLPAKPKTTRKTLPLYSHDGFLFRFVKQLSDGSELLYCDKRKTSVKCTAIANRKNGIIEIRKQHHGHDRQDEHVNAKLARYRIRERAAMNRRIPSKELLQEAEMTFGPISGSPAALSKMISRARNRNQEEVESAEVFDGQTEQGEQEYGANSL
ncbi:unnamed protein product [Caenorhabditis sp. 36 PRJEB53466]|nr:unnamed protein product [Caenorhabditis sp. 36 PRJEB53466]